MSTSLHNTYVRLAMKFYFDMRDLIYTQGILYDEIKKFESKVQLL